MPRLGTPGFNLPKISSGIMDLLHLCFTPAGEAGGLPARIILGRSGSLEAAAICSSFRGRALMTSNALRGSGFCQASRCRLGFSGPCKRARASRKRGGCRGKLDSPWCRIICLGAAGHSTSNPEEGHWRLVIASMLCSLQISQDTIHQAARRYEQPGQQVHHAAR